MRRPDTRPRTDVARIHPIQRGLLRRAQRTAADLPERRPAGLVQVREALLARRRLATRTSNGRALSAGKKERSASPGLDRRVAAERERRVGGSARARRPWSPAGTPGPASVSAGQPETTPV